MSDLEACYADNVGKLRFISGTVQLKFRVATDGTVKRVQVAEGTLGAWPMEKCLLGIARRMSFSRPKGGEAEFSFPIEFPGRGRVVAMDEALVEAELVPKLAELAACPEEAQVPAPREVMITVYVGPGGAVKSAGFGTPSDRPYEDAWADCAYAKALAWKLPDPRGKIWKARTWIP
jgi:TonB family protein